MKVITKLLIITSILGLVFLINVACLWDKDTIEMERQRFPNALELITGNFVRHSTEFYEWRIKDRTEKFESQANNLAYYDDLAVAYDKVGNSKKAIEIMLKKESVKSGLYETYANLGTFYIHDNQLEKGLICINKAIEINPNAHFGREVYQKYLVEYILKKKKFLEKKKINEPLLPLSLKNKTLNNEGKKYYYYKKNFYDFLVSKTKKKDKYGHHSLSKIELQKAVKGILGMMRFGNYDSPILLEVLGDLLFGRFIKDIDVNASHLAYFAYTKAGIENKNMRALYDKINVLYGTKFDTEKNKFKEKLDSILNTSIKNGKKLYDNIRKDEIAWIRSQDPEMEFGKKYYDKPIKTVENNILKKEEKKQKQSNNYNSFIFIGLGILFLTLSILYFRKRKVK